MDELEQALEEYEQVKQKVFDEVSPLRLQNANPQNIIKLGPSAVDACKFWLESPVVDIGNGKTATINRAILVCALSMFAEGKGGVNPYSLQKGGVKQQHARKLIEAVAAGRMPHADEGDGRNAIEFAKQWIKSGSK